MRRYFNNWTHWITVILLSQCLLAQAGEAPSPKLKHDERIVFLGDSATGQHGYTAFVADYFALCHPEMHLSFRTSASDAIWRVADGTVNALPSVQADAIDVHPAIAIVNFGADDAGKPGFGARQLPYFAERLPRIVRDLKQQGITVLLMTPADLSTGGAVPPDEWYGRVIDAVLAVAAKENTPLINLNSAMRDLRKRAKESNQPAIPLTAGTTLGPAGHAMAALLVLRALGLDASPASVEIDASTGKSNCIRCKIEGLAVAGDRLSFARTDEALPMAFPPEVKPVLSMLPGHEFNSYGLKVTGLKAGTWKLKVQDREIGLFTAAELAAGVDLSNLPGPWRELADGVHRKSIAIEDAFSLRCHYGSEPRIPAGAEPQRRALVDKLDAGIEKLVAEQAEMMHAPTTWNWSLSLDKP